MKFEHLSVVLSETNRIIQPEIEACLTRFI